MPKPPDSPPSSDIGGVHTDRYHQDDGGKTKGQPGEAEDLARRESRGRPADSKR